VDRKGRPYVAYICREPGCGKVMHREYGDEDEWQYRMCGVDDKGKKVSDCGNCICERSNDYDKHNRVAAGTTKIGETTF
jgi:hypothetical protein